MAVVPFRRSPPYPQPPSGLPQDVEGQLEYGFRRAFPHDLAISHSDPALWLRYKVSLRDNGVDFNGVTAHELVGWIIKRGQRIGMLRLDEWRLPPWVDDRDFFEATDSWSQLSADFGAAVLSAWDPWELALYGPIVELSRVWMHPDHAHRSLWADAVRALIRRRYAKRFSVLFLTTWPADYKAEEARELDWRGYDRWDRRRTSLGRLARQKLGVRPFPAGCPEEDRWWFWLPLRDEVPMPRKRRSQLG